MTLRSVQIKGIVTSVNPAGAADHQRIARYCDEFFGAVREVDGYERHLLDRLVPRTFVVCDVVVNEVYDQTPGPGAGATLSRSAP